VPPNKSDIKTKYKAYNGSEGEIDIKDMIEKIGII
jgi:hypothetical protein